VFDLVALHLLEFFNPLLHPLLRQPPPLLTRNVLLYTMLLLSLLFLLAPLAQDSLLPPPSRHQELKPCFESGINLLA